MVSGCVFFAVVKTGALLRRGGAESGLLAFFPLLLRAKALYQKIDHARYGFAGLALVVALGLREGRQGLSLKGQRVGLAWLLGTAVIAGFIGILCWNMGNKILTPMNGVLFMDVVPLTAFSISAMTGVTPTAAEITGAGMTGAALILNNLYLRYRGAKTAMLARQMQEERLPSRCD